MPNMDGTGPVYTGNKIGMGFGPCGQGLRRGLGRGFLRMTDAASSKEEQRKILQSQKEQIEKKIRSLEE